MMGKTDRDQQVTRACPNAGNCRCADSAEDLGNQRYPEDRPDQLTPATEPRLAAPGPLPSRPAPARRTAHPGVSGPPIADLGMLARVRTALLQM